jgi:hypothetical protein
MKLIFKILKYLIIGIVSLVVVVFIGLQFYYQSINFKMPQPEAIADSSIYKPIVNATTHPVLLPVPKSVAWQAGVFKLGSTINFNAPAKDKDLVNTIIKEHLRLNGKFGGSTINCNLNNKLSAQAYHLAIKPSGVTIEYNDAQGLFFAFTTLKQLAVQTGGQIPCVKIEDQPDLKVRGAMLDISRGKVPTLETLYGMVDFLADLKYNQLQLYVEGFSFAYPSFTKLWEKTETPITPEEIKKLDIYCKNRNIELVPNQNSLGHMAAWIATDEYKDLAECPDGYKLLGLINFKSTIAPKDPRSLALVKKMSEDMLPNFTSNKFNVNLDEPFELGKNKEHPINDPKEVARVYLDYAKKLNEFVNSKGKSMMMWGDVVARNHEFIPEVPKNVTLLEWRYEDFQSFKSICATYKQAGLNYMVCPGTSSWSSFTGRTANMMKNVENATTAGFENNAQGILMTDWGDTPHLQYLTVSYPGLAYAGALGWNVKSKTQVNLAAYMNKVVFNDKQNIIGDLMLQAGNYVQFEDMAMVSSTKTGMGLRFGMVDKVMTKAIMKKIKTGMADLLPSDPATKAAFLDKFNNVKTYNYIAILKLMDALDKQIAFSKINRADSSIVVSEYKNAFNMVRVGAMLTQYSNYCQEQTDQQNKDLLLKMKALCISLQKEHDRLWLIRNKKSDLEQSKVQFATLQKQIDEKLKALDGNAISRMIGSSIDRAKYAAIVLFLGGN